MIRLPLAIETEPMRLSPQVRQSFGPSLVFRTHPAAAPFFTTFVILDFRAGVVRYVHSHSPENDAVVRRVDPNLVALESHAALAVDPARSFYDFLLQTLVFPSSWRTRPPAAGEAGFVKRAPIRLVDLEERVMTLVFGRDLPCASGPWLGQTSETSGKDVAGNIFVAFGRTDRKATEAYRCSPDLRTVTKVFEWEGSDLPPHTVLPHGPYVLAPGFLVRRSRLLKTGRILENDAELEDHVYGVLREEFRRGAGATLGAEAFEPAFERFVAGQGAFLDLCARHEELAFETLPGTIYQYDTRRPEQLPREYATDLSPSHYEIDPVDGAIYAAACNFLVIRGNVVFIRPGTVHKFVPEGEGFVRVADFSHPTCYRNTSHKVTRRHGHPYVMSVGFPNRLHVFDGETAKLCFHYDMGDDMLSGKEDVRAYLNRKGPLPGWQQRYRQLNAEFSADGNYILFWQDGEVRFLDVETQQVVDAFPFRLRPGYVLDTRNHTDALV